MRAVLTIAGSDCSGGAGIQADLKTITAYGMYGMSVITALTAQNTRGVYAVSETPKDMLRGQLEAVFSDIMPEAVKIGLLPSRAAALLVSEFLLQYRPAYVVIDPVMASASGCRFMNQDTITAAGENLFEKASLLTPNVPEALALLEGERHREHLESRAETEKAALALQTRYRTAVLLKGGHQAGGADDCLAADGNLYWFEGERIHARGSHGTGCTLSAAIACGLAAGHGLEEAVRQAKRYVTGALQNAPGLGGGNGPLNHCFTIPEAGRIF
ncbi:MAG: bifunctional hydroxymethylpyrimidine kinase/phosphomethylpyrimidine kinase [Lachnospiraceae bacterium]|jgi:hydroxymethylpyrimidine/phosphomethylpyrimidine kinase|nr:bifunctional hydroxymethylpyrimidine kinase/phosphomethylpyrimidine kinase [Lachnospiraceae bacterium]